MRAKYRQRKRIDGKFDSSLISLAYDNSIPRSINREEEVENENLSFATSRLRYESGQFPISPKGNQNVSLAKYMKFSLNPTISEKKFLSGMDSSLPRQTKNKQDFLNFTGPLKLAAEEPFDPVVAQLNPG